MELADRSLVHALLVRELEHTVTRTFGHADPTGPPDPPRHRRRRHRREDAEEELDVCAPWRWPRLADPPERRTFFPGCVAFTWMCCSCQFC